MKRVVFTNDKGGVGKTTTVANLAFGLGLQGRKTLVVDMDPQADVTFAFLGTRPLEVTAKVLPATVYSLLLGHHEMGQTIVEIPGQKNLFLIPACTDLADVAPKLTSRPTRLRRLLDELEEDSFDVVLIDTGKGLDPLAINALAAAQDVIAMVTPGRLELDAITRLAEHVSLVREEVLLDAEEPVIRGILLTLADRYSITKDTIERINDQFPGLLLKTSIPRNNDLQKAIARARSIFDVAPRSKGAEAYNNLLEELDL